MTSPNDQSASRLLADMLEQWGIGELNADAQRMMKEGLSSDAIIFELQSTDAYKVRFAGNEDRRKAGLAVLSPAEYVAVETQYKTVMRTYGLPTGFYDSNSDLQKFIAADVSPSELTERAAAAQSIWLSTDKETQRIWQDWHGLSGGAAIAAILDPDVALPLIERQVTSARIGGAAARNGLGLDESRANLLSDMGLTAEGALDAYGTIGQTLAAEKSIASRFGTKTNQTQSEDARILGTASAKRKLSRLQSSEAGLFDERGGAAAGALGRSTAGRY